MQFVPFVKNLASGTAAAGDVDNMATASISNHQAGEYEDLEPT
jgi:hypothetical protein